MNSSINFPRRGAQLCARTQVVIQQRQKMGIELAVRPYRRRFAKPLQTAHGRWVWREGLLIRLRNSEGRVGYGEVAPIPWFGSETIEAAQEFLAIQAGEWRSQPIPDTLSATQFGLECALADLQGKIPPMQYEPAISADSAVNANLCGLLPAGKAVLDTAPQRLTQGHRTLKWKIGVFSFAQELGWLQALWPTLPSTTRLRLDANGGLDFDLAERWLALCDALNRTSPGAVIEHLEQPLPVDQIEQMKELGKRYRTAIALDESVATLAQLEDCWARGWRGVVVVKPAIAGSPQRLRAFCQRHHPRLVFSSSFETAIGRGAALALASAWASSPAPALGFGTQGWFDDDWDTLGPAELWNRL